MCFNTLTFQIFKFSSILGVFRPGIPIFPMVKTPQNTILYFICSSVFILVLVERLYVSTDRIFPPRYNVLTLASWPIVPCEQAVYARPFRILGAPGRYSPLRGGTGWMLSRGYSRGNERRRTICFQPRAAPLVRGKEQATEMKRHCRDLMSV